MLKFYEGWHRVNDRKKERGVKKYKIVKEPFEVSAMNVNEERMDDTIEQGRLALLTLERQLQESTYPAFHSKSNSGGGSGGGGGSSGNQEPSVNATNRTTSTLSSERRLLDQAPRDLRLNNRMGSPLGLTIEELDDRGLLEGGMVPNYYASSRQRGRRPLEMKKRSRYEFLHPLNIILPNSLSHDVQCVCCYLLSTPDIIFVSFFLYFSVAYWNVAKKRLLK